jgi:hypothetical protein
MIMQIISNWKPMIASTAAITACSASSSRAIASQPWLPASSGQRSSDDSRT